MSGAGSSDSGLDLSGKLIIKAQLGNDIRRIPIHNEDMTYDELILMMQRVFRGSLSPDDDITLKYKDEDGDLVTIFDSSDLAFAIQCSRILKLTILLNGQQGTAKEQQLPTSAVRQELRAIRDRVTALLDALDVCSDTSPKTVAENSGVSSSSSVNAVGSGSPAPPSIKPISVSSKEFDPLQQAEQQHQQQAQPVPPPPVISTSQPQPVINTQTPTSATTTTTHTESDGGINPSCSQVESSTSITSTSTTTSYHQSQQQPHPQSQTPQPKPLHPSPQQQQQQQPQQPQQQQQQPPNYANYGAGQHYGGSGSDVTAGAPTTATSTSQSHTSQQQYYPGYPPYSGYGVASSQPSGYNQQYPSSQTYPSNYTHQTGGSSPMPPSSQPGPSPAGPRSQMSYVPPTPYQPWPQQ